MAGLSILIPCLNFKNFTGSELYVYELALGLKNAGCDVAIMSQLGGPLTDKAIEKGLPLYSFSAPPQKKSFDLIHSQHFPVTEACLRTWPNHPHICSIHSEIIDMERPVKDERIRRYIAIRPGIIQHLRDHYQISPSSIALIRNPIDGDRFNKTGASEDGFLLFVGTIDYLREQAIRDLVSMAEASGNDVLLIGKNKSSYLDELLAYPHVKYRAETDNVEVFTKRCTHTAGIMLGRTTVEGWLCGKSGWVYDVDESGGVVSKKLINPPSDIHEYQVSNVIKNILRVYDEVLRGG